MARTPAAGAIPPALDPGVRARIEWLTARLDETRKQLEALEARVKALEDAP